MINKNELYGSIKLNGDTVFEHNLAQDKDKYEKFLEGIKSGKITNFDQVTMTRLRKLYFGFYSAIIFLYYFPTDFDNIGNKVELLTHVFEDKKFQIVHGNVDSTRDIKFFMYGAKHLDYNSWIEVQEGNKTWVYDPFSMLRFEKNLYYELEHPDVFSVVPAEAILNFPGRDNDCEFFNYHDSFAEMLFMDMPEMEKNIETHPFKNILVPELTRFKNAIDYDNLKLRLAEETGFLMFK